MDKLHKEFNGFGRPVLVRSKPEYKTGELNGEPYFVVIPVHAFFGAETYFCGEDKITTSCGGIEYDAAVPENAIEPEAHMDTFIYMLKYYWTSFRTSTDDEIKACLEDPKVHPNFKKLALELLEKLDY